MCRKSTSPVATNLYTFRNERSDELGGMAVNRFKDEYGSEWLETVAMTPQGIQPHSEEKEIVCLVWSLDAVEGRSPDTILLVLPNGMVETVGSIPSSISKIN